MCGIAGVITNTPESEVTLRTRTSAMAETLTHRGPDDDGCWVDIQAGVGLGFRRLAIVDVSETGHQPMLSANGRYAAVFNGEIYNFRELRSELGSAGIRFRGTSDTEVMLAAVSVWGVREAVSRLWGMFAIALWDTVERTLWLARDRLGKKPLYYGTFGGTFLFGSELKALRAHPAFRAEIDPDAVISYLRFAYVPAPRSIYRGVSKLPPGTLARISPGAEPVVVPYWQPRDFLSGSNGVPLNDTEAINHLDALLRDAVARRMIADVPLGALLSGGIDSSVVVALMQAQSSRAVKTFTIGFHQAEYDEAAAARAVAEHLGTDHEEFYVTPDETRATIPLLPDLYDEPFADSSQIPTFVLSQLTRRHVTVALAGDGGDELFGGYTRYDWAATAWQGLEWWPAGLRQWLSRLALSVSTETWDRLYHAGEWALPDRRRLRFAGDKVHKFAEIAGASDRDVFCRGVTSIWKDPRQIVRRDYPGVEGPYVPNAVADVPCPDLPTRLMQIDLVTYLPDDILVKVDRASMGTSLEVRAPLLDHRIVEWALHLPLHMKIRDNTTKWILRQVLYRYVPASLVERPKMGFGVPIGLWMRGPLREWAESLLTQSELDASGVFDAAAVRRVWAEHTSGTRNHEHRLWVIVMFQAWRRRWGL